ncbi:MAG: peptidylprolyl isomerase [Lachnospiraceae bacterium]|nr:peptidylprolyl isomerase [Lachnospiraceae bacterium]
MNLFKISKTAKRAPFTRLALCLLSMMIVLTFIGCDGDKTVVLTTGLSEDEIFKIESEVCTRPEIMLYLTNMQNVYEGVYGEQIWETDVDGVSIQESLKETVLARISRVKVLKLLAEEEGVSLNKEEKQKAEEAGKEYFATLSEEEIEILDVTEELVISMYEEYALADKVYHYLIQDVNPEISDDDARTITVSHILIRTFHVDLNGQVKPYSEAAKAEALQRAKEILQMAKDGEDFEQLVLTYNEDTKGSLSFRKGEMPAAYEEAAFNLANEEISQIVETEYGYYIIKCTNTFDREETDANKIIILGEQKEAAFQVVYEEFLGTLTGNLNQKEWQAVTLITDPSVTTDSFFTIYEKYFANTMEY